MPRAALPIVCLLGLFALGGAGCLKEVPGTSHNLLRPARMSPDAVGLDILFARVAPAQASQLEKTLWSEVDEQTLSAEVRRTLQTNGIRAGVVGAPIPPVLAELLELRKGEIKKPAGEGDKVDHDPQVTRRFLELRSGKRGEIQTSSLRDQMTVLLPRNGELLGQTFEKAQGLFAVKAAHARDGRIRVELIPEIQHGEAVGRFQPTQDGMFVMDSRRQNSVYDDLRLEVQLAPGELLVLTAIPERPGSLGAHLFAHESAGEKSQKLLVVRVALQSGEGDL